MPRSWAGKRVFQSTCLREARRTTCLSRFQKDYFNPRAYVRHDQPHGPSRTRPPDFNPRAYVRHDLGVRADQRGVFYFNPRAYVRHDQTNSHIPSYRRYFNPRAYVRHDYEGWEDLTAAPFQSTCLREARPCNSNTI